jgi:hypothetical protein
MSTGACDGRHVSASAAWSFTVNTNRNANA